MSNFRLVGLTDVNLYIGQASQCQLLDRLLWPVPICICYSDRCKSENSALADVMVVVVVEVVVAVVVVRRARPRRRREEMARRREAAERQRAAAVATPRRSSSDLNA